MYPIVPFRDFTAFTPSVPAFYNNVYSQEEGIKKILYELDKLAEYANAIAEEVNDTTNYVRMDKRVAQLESEVRGIADELDALAAGGRYRNPVTGGYDYAYVVARQMYAALRIQCMTWAELRDAGKTWAEIAAEGKTYLEVDIASNILFGDSVPKYRTDAAALIDTDTPGYVFKEF